MTFEEYLATVDESRRPTLIALRKLVHEAAPAAIETTRYKMPYFEHHGDLCAFAAQKNYFSFYVLSGGLPLTAHRDRLGKLDCGKGCIRFRSLDQLPVDVLREIVADAARANEERAAVGAD